MSPAARAPYASCVVRRGVWLRVLVLLLALFLPGTAAHCAAAESVVSGAAAAEHDVLDTALRLPGRSGHRPVVPLRPVPRPPLSARHPATTAAHPLPVQPPRPEPRIPRSVVLRC
ncbi:hypothetical protein [Streptomyces sp. NPDC047042]|uniref:hypothetical protein n=1 Tax=Streptomyces sp. NPDC047042 TaxID=3154807 RepID=UPI0033D802D9